MNAPNSVTDILGNLTYLSSKMNITSVPNGILCTLSFSSEFQGEKILSFWRRAVLCMSYPGG